MEAEARAILAETCLAPEPPDEVVDLQDLVDRFYGKQKPANTVEELIR
jgi:hypothetical protein